jgi:hypothetical protein
LTSGKVKETRGGFEVTRDNKISLEKTGRAPAWKTMSPFFKIGAGHNMIFTNKQTFEVRELISMVQFPCPQYFTFDET